jgi:hypothetical protein
MKVLLHKLKLQTSVSYLGVLAQERAARWMVGNAPVWRR